MDTLVFELSARGSAQVDGPGGRFTRGQKRLHFWALHVFDATGRVLPMGQRALIGAWGVACSQGTACGRAYTFVRQGEDGVEEDRFAPVDLNDEDFFGEAVTLSLDGLPAIIGSPGAAGGTVYGFNRRAGDWVEKGSVTGFGGAFGASVASSGDARTVLVGAYLENGAAGNDYGAA